MSASDSQQNPVISRELLEKSGIHVPYDAVSFYTEKENIIFKMHICEEAGCSIVFKEELEGYEITEKQVEALKAANCYLSTECDLE